MAIKMVQKESPKAVLVSVTAEMAKPRVVESAKKARATGKYGWIAPSGKKGLFRPSGLRSAAAPGEKPISRQFVPMWAPVQIF